MSKEILSPKLVDIFSGIIQQYDTEPEKKDILGFMEKVLLESNSFDSPTEAKNIAAEISQTIDALDESYKDLREHTRKGLARDSWLQKKIEYAISLIPESDRDSTVREIKDALVKANDDLFEGLYQEKSPAEFSDVLEDCQFKGLNKTAIVQNLKKDIQNNTIMGAITIEEGFKLKIDKEHKEIKAVKDYLDEKLDSPDDADFKKVVASAAIIAKKKGFKPLQNISNDEISTIVDNGVTNVKLAYKVANGEIDPIDVVDYIIDRRTAAFSTIVVHKCKKFGAAVGGKIGAAIGSVFGPVGTVIGSGVGAIVGYIGGTVVGQVVAKGVKKVAGVCKDVCRSVYDGVKEFASSAWDTLTGWL